MKLGLKLNKNYCCQTCSDVFEIITSEIETWLKQHRDRDFVKKSATKTETRKLVRFVYIFLNLKKESSLALPS